MTKVIKNIETFLKDELFISSKPSFILNELKHSNSIGLIPELIQLSSTPQDPNFHPEGDVWNHTLMVVDEVASMSEKLDFISKKILLLSALFHDIAKPVTTIYSKGRFRSPKHDVLGEKITKRILTKLTFDELIINKSCSLIKYHLIPNHFFAQKEIIGKRAFRKIMRKVDVELLLLLSEADYRGRNINNTEKEYGSPAVKWMKNKITEL